MLQYLLLFTNEGQEVNVVLLVASGSVQDAEMAGSGFASVAKIVEHLVGMFGTLLRAVSALKRNIIMAS